MLGFDVLRGQNIADMVFAIFALYVSDDKVTSVIGEVDVDIRHRDTLWVKEPLKEESVFDRVNGNNTQTEGHKRSSA